MRQRGGARFAAGRVMSRDETFRCRPDGAVCPARVLAIQIPSATSQAAEIALDTRVLAVSWFAFCHARHKPLASTTQSLLRFAACLLLQPDVCTVIVVVHLGAEAGTPRGRWGVSIVPATDTPATSAAPPR